MTCRLHDPPRFDCPYCPRRPLDDARFLYREWRGAVDEVGYITGTVLWMVAVLAWGYGI